MKYFLFVLICLISTAVFADINFLEKSLLEFLVNYAATEWPLIVAIFLAIWPHVRAWVRVNVTNKYLRALIEIMAANYGTAKNKE